MYFDPQNVGQKLMLPCVKNRYPIKNDYIYRNLDGHDQKL